MKKGFFETLGTMTFLAIVLTVSLDVWAIRSALLLHASVSSTARAYFLDVGQGDGELVVLPGGIKIMTDAGPDEKVLASLSNVLPPGDTYIDIAIVSHPQLDHFNGYTSILDHYDVGAFIYNGRDDDPGVAAWPAFLTKVRAKHIPLITLAKGDIIRYGASDVQFLGPDREFDESAELNDTGFVELVRTPGMRILLTADIGSNVENALLAGHSDIRADVLKVAHHGSRYSSENDFLKAVDPKIAVIEVGAHNTYGHPSRETLMRIASSTRAALFRTDKNGTVTVWREGEYLRTMATGP